MITAVQQLSERGGPFAVLVFPDARLVRGSRGSVALLEGGELALYVLRLNGRRRAFVFRTVHTPQIEHTILPGVAPGVELLLEVRTERRVRRVRQLFAALASHHRDPSALSDDFYVRASVVLNGNADISVDALVSALISRESVRCAEEVRA